MSDLKKKKQFLPVFIIAFMSQVIDFNNCGIKFLEKYLHSHKVQLISKCLFGIVNSPKKEQKKIDFTTMHSYGT